MPWVSGPGWRRNHLHRKPQAFPFQLQSSLTQSNPREGAHSPRHTASLPFPPPAPRGFPGWAAHVAGH